MMFSSFLVSVIYSKAKLASACGGIIYFLSYVPYMYVAIREEVAHDKITAFEKCIAVSLHSSYLTSLSTHWISRFKQSEYSWCGKSNPEQTSLFVSLPVSDVHDSLWPRLQILCAVRGRRRGHTVEDDQPVAGGRGRLQPGSLHDDAYHRRRCVRCADLVHRGSASR